MSTQATASTIGNAAISRVFTNTGTDGTYSNAIDSVSSTALGLALPGVTISFVNSVYTAGLGTWRIVSSTTGVIKRMGLMSKTAYASPAEGQIIPYTIAGDDLFQTYTNIADATANQSNVIALVHSTAGVEAFTGTDIVDATSTALTSIVAGLGLGDLLFGKVVSKIELQQEDAGFAGNITIIDSSGGTVYTAYGATRLPTAGGNSYLTNLSVNTNVPVSKGYALKVKVTTA